MPRMAAITLSALALVFVVPQIPYAQSCPIVGATIVAKDGTFLGTVGSKYDSNSIFNEYGSYGGKYSSKSIFNEYGTYGSKYGTNSVFNEYSSDPPRIVFNGSVIGYLSVNRYLSGAINPYALVAACAQG